MRNFIFFTLSFAPIFVWASENAKVNFYKGNLMTIQETAKAEGKLYIYDFVASWCTPCKWMDETTYADPTLAQYIEENYILAKADIDDFDGFALKEKYKVQVLPTILIFNHDGKVVGRYEESLSPTKMIDILKKHNTITNGAGKIAKPTKPKTLARPALTPAKPTTVAEPKPKEKVNESPSKPLPTKENKATYNIGFGLYKMDISRRPNTGFSIQMISLGQYDNVVKTYEELKKAHDKQPILMFVENSSGKTTYKIMIGEFKTREEAEKYKKSKAPEGYIKELAKLK